MNAPVRKRQRSLASRETALSRDIQRSLKRIGAVVIRIQSGTIRLPGRYMRLAERGTPDLFVAWRGTQLFLEVKDQGQVHGNQAAMHDALRANGARVEVVWSVAQALAFVRGDSK